MNTLVLRPVRMQDHTPMMTLAILAGFGMTSLPQDSAVMHAKIEDAVKSFTGQPPLAAQHIFLFVLEDIASGEIVGTTGIKAHVGMSNPFYSYKLSTLVQSNSDLGIYSRQRVLHMVNDFTGATEIGSLFLHKNYRHSAIGQFLSRTRFLMMAEFPDLFSDTVIAELRGIHDAQGDSPFYNNLARHFFQMPFYKADYIFATKGNQFISDLMPHYPIYVTMLPTAAQKVIGQIFPSSQPAARILMEEGFKHEGYVDLFDAGPTLQAERARIATICGSKKAQVSAVQPVQSEKRFMICNTTLSNLRFVCDHLHAHTDGTVTITPETAQRLELNKNDWLRFAPQFPVIRKPENKDECN